MVIDADESMKLFPPCGSDNKRLILRMKHVAAGIAVTKKSIVNWFVEIVMYEYVHVQML